MALDKKNLDARQLELMKESKVIEEKGKILAKEEKQLLVRQTVLDNKGIYLDHKEQTKTLQQENQSQLQKKMDELEKQISIRKQKLNDLENSPHPQDTEKISKGNKASVPMKRHSSEDVFSPIVKHKRRLFTSTPLKADTSTESSILDAGALLSPTDISYQPSSSTSLDIR